MSEPEPDGERVAGIPLDRHLHRDSARRRHRAVVLGIRLARELGLADRVHFTGFRTDSAAWLRSVDLSVLSSVKEGLSNTIIESMAAGRPVVVSGDVGLAPVVEQSGAGLVVNGEPETVAAAMAQVIGDPRAGAAMGERGRALVQQRYSWAVVARQMEALYASVIGASGRA